MPAASRKKSKRQPKSTNDHAQPDVPQTAPASGGDDASAHGPPRDSETRTNGKQDSTNGTSPASKLVSESQQPCNEAADGGNERGLTMPQHSSDKIETAPKSQVDSLTTQLQTLKATVTSDAQDARTKTAKPVTLPSSVGGPFSSTTYPDLPPSLKIAHSVSPHGQDRGRGLFATETIPVGKIFDTLPAVNVMHEDCHSGLHARCSYCLMSGLDLDWQQKVEKARTNEQNGGGVISGAVTHDFLHDAPLPGRIKLHKCSGCKRVNYCSKEHQVADWKLHKFECKALQNFGAKIKAMNVSEDAVPMPYDIVRGVARLVWLKLMPGHEQLWRQIDAMHCDFDKLVDRDKKEYVKNMVNYVTNYVGVEKTYQAFPNRHRLTKLVSQWTTNAHCLFSIAGDLIGSTLSPVISLINHSCEANAAIIFPHERGTDHRTIRLRALREIQEGEELFVSYADNGLPTPTRRGHLKSQFHFDCDCELCSRSQRKEDVDVRESLMCIKEDCDGHAQVSLSEFWDHGRRVMKEYKQLTLRCLTCSQEWEIEVSKVCNLLSKLQKFLTDEQKKEEAGSSQAISWPANEVIAKLDILDKLKQEKCILGTWTYPYPSLCTALENNLSRFNREHLAILRKHCSPIPTFLYPGEHMRSMTACRNLAFANQDATYALNFQPRVTSDDVNDLVEFAFRVARDCLEEVEMGLGRDSAVYQVELVQVKRLMVQCVMLLQKVRMGSGPLVAVREPFGAAQKLAAAHGFIIPQLS
ncbi:hypothetical protein ACM66B_004377 [Microbotryomycetes sp. NB124-2]